MKARITFAASALALLSLTGCASQSQIEEQNKQLAAINVTLTQIQAAQAESLTLQKMQTKLQVESHNLQSAQFQQQSLRK
jgi:murein lipoprotein